MTRLIDDYVIAASAAVIVAAVVILAAFLLRYTKLVEEADKSTRLAKDVWNSVNSRFTVVDARLIDLMAKSEVLSSRFGQPQPTSVPRATSIPTSKPREMLGTQAPIAESTETEAKVLRMLFAGPRTSAQIKEEVGRSREHTARLLKGLFDRGLVIRNDRNKPYVYEITDNGRSYVES